MLEIPKLEDKGPLALIFEDGKLDTENLNIIVTDMMENNFGATQVAAALTQLLTERSDLEAALYGFECDGFSGNLSFPNYTTKGSVVSTVEGYRGQAPMYLLVIGPVNEVEEFDNRLHENLPDAVDLHRAAYINSAEYINSGVGAFQTVSSLDHKIQGGNYDTLNYTVNAFLQKAQNGAFAFAFDDSYVAHGYVDQAQISLIASMDADSPFRTSQLDITGLTVEAVGSDGTLTVIRDLRMKEPYIGTIDLVSGEIAEDITAYFAQSEQIPTACALGVLVGKDQSVTAAGGYIIQLLPGAPDDIIDKIESGIQNAGAVSRLLAAGMDGQVVLETVLHGFDLEILETQPVEYRCYCSRDRVTRTLISLGRTELQSIVDDGKDIHIDCQFCDKIYDYTPDQVRQILKDLDG